MNHKQLLFKALSVTLVALLGFTMCVNVYAQRQPSKAVSVVVKDAMGRFWNKLRRTRPASEKEVA